MPTTELSTYVNSLPSATLSPTDVVYLADDEKTTVQDIANFNGTLKTTIINIGDWNMDATGSVSIAHTIADYSKIRTVDVMIIPDASTTLIPLVIGSAPAGATAGYIGQITSTNIILFRVAGASFDSVDYDSTSFNRGYITIQYVP